MYRKPYPENGCAEHSGASEEVLGVRVGAGQAYKEVEIWLGL